MSARLAEALAKVAQLQADLGEAYTELSALYDVEGAKSGKAGADAAAGKASAGASGKGVAPKGGAVGKAKVKPAEAEDDTDVDGSAEDDGDDLPEPTAPTKKDTAKPKPAAKAAAKTGKAKKVTEDDVRALAKQVIEKFDKDTAVAILSEFGDGKLADVDEEDYADCAAKLQAKLDEEDDAGSAEGDDDI